MRADFSENIFAVTILAKLFDSTAFYLGNNLIDSAAEVSGEFKTREVSKAWDHSLPVIFRCLTE